MEIYSDFDYADLVSQHIWLYTHVGLLPPREESFRSKLFNWCCLVVTCMLLVPLTIGEVAQMYIYLQIKDINKISKASFLMLTHLVQCGKYWAVISKRTRLASLLKSINRSEFKPKNKKQIKILQGWIKFTKILFKGSMVLVSSCTASLVLTSFMEDQLKLPLDVWYPFDTNAKYTFQIMCIYQFIGTVFSGVVNACWDLLSTVLLTVVCSQLEILNDSLENLRFYREYEGHAGLSDKMLKECIRHHTCILEFYKETSSILLSTIFGQFLVIAIIICLTLFEMASVSLVSFRFCGLNLYLACMLLEIFLSCYFGSEITVQSSLLIKSAFKSEWYNCSKNLKQNLLIFMRLCQQDIKIYAGGLISLSLGTFLNVLKSSWSYYTLLTRMKNTDQ